MIKGLLLGKCLGDGHIPNEKKGLLEPLCGGGGAVCEEALS